MVAAAARRAAMLKRKADECISNTSGKAPTRISLDDERRKKLGAELIASSGATKSGIAKVPQTLQNEGLSKDAPKERDRLTEVSALASEKPFPICFGLKRRAVVDLDPEPDKRQSTIGTADSSTQTAIGLVAGPKLFIHNVREAPLYMSRREYELFVKRRGHHVATQTGFE